MSRLTTLQHKIHIVTEKVLCEQQFGAFLDVGALFYIQKSKYVLKYMKTARIKIVQQFANINTKQKEKK